MDIEHTWILRQGKIVVILGLTLIDQFVHLVGGEGMG